MKPQKRTTKTGAVRWVARYTDPTGKERSKSFDTRREAKVFLQEQERDIRRGNWVDPKDQQVTVADLVEDYISLATKPGTKRDREILRDNLGPLADMPVRAVRQAHVESWALQLRDGRPWAEGTSLAAETVKVKTGQMKTVLQRAVDDGLIDRNPAVVLKRFDAGRKEEFYVPTTQEVKALYDYAKQHGPLWFALAVRLGAEAGLRAGEVCGLRVKDVDFMRRVIHVRVQTTPGKAGGELVPLKSLTSRRDVPISEDLALELSGFLVGRPVGQDDLIFVGDWGRPLYSARVSQVISRVREGAGVSDRVHFHSLRHLFASRLLASGADLPTVSGLLGHADVAVTARVYAHQLPGREDVARSLVVRASGFFRDFGPGEGAGASG